jgi:hypothetical protein
VKQDKLFDAEEILKQFSESSNMWNRNVGHIEARVGLTTGMHEYEICLSHMLRTLNTLWLENDDNRDSLRFWARTAAVDIVKCCLALKLDPREYLGSINGNFIVRPNYNGFAYFEYLALKTQLTKDWVIRPLLDFHLVNGYSIDSNKRQSKENSKTIPFSHEQIILKGLEFYTRHFIVTYPISKDLTPLQHLEHWISSRFDRFSHANLIEYHRYSFDEKKASPERNKGETIVYNAGCNSNYLVQFFSLLKNVNGSANGVQSFVHPKLVDKILYTYFGIGETPQLDGTEKASIDINQVAWFIGEFVDNRKHGKNSPGIGYQQWFEIFSKVLPDVFKNCGKISTLVGNRKKYAKNGHAYYLDWRNSPQVKTAVENEKSV